jgi:hypothetical protein
MPFRDLSAHFRKHANLRHVAGNNGERQHHPTAFPRKLPCLKKLVSVLRLGRQLFQGEKG